MNPISIPLLTQLFTTAGWLLGIPSGSLLAAYGVYRLTRTADGAAAGTDFGPHPDALLLMLKGISGAVQALGNLVNSAGQFIFNVLAGVATVGLVLSIVCWFTGRGLGAQAHWARISAGLVLSIVLLPSLLLGLSLHNLGRWMMLALAAFCVAALHAVWTGYAPRVP